MSAKIYRALIVDDEPMIREGLSRTMVKHSFCCDTAEDGCDALPKFREHAHDLVVTDLRMPKKHGHALVLELISEPNPPHIVVLTGIANHRLTKDLFSRGVHDVVQKPVEFNVFATKMLSIFERGQWSDALCRDNATVAGSSQQQLVTKTEAAIEMYSLCVPPPLEAALSVSLDSLNPPPEAVLSMMRRLSAQRATSDERRRKDRFTLLSTAIAIPVSKDFVPVGEPMTVTISNLSGTGACLFHTRSVAAEYLALRWGSAISPKYFLKAVMQVKRCVPLGTCYEVAGEFVMHD